MIPVVVLAALVVFTAWDSSAETPAEIKVRQRHDDSSQGRG